MEAAEERPTSAHAFPEPGRQNGTARKADIGTTENRPQQSEKSFAAKRKIVWRSTENRLADIANKFLRKVQAKINARTRGKFDFSTPKLEFFKHFFKHFY